MDPVPIHQEADPLNPNAVSATAIATGLKICFLLIAKIYFEAIVRTAAQKSKGRSEIDFIGERISAKINADMQTDSTFVGTLNTRAKILFVIQEMTIRNRTEMRREKGPYERIPKEQKIYAMKRRKIK